MLKFFSRVRTFENLKEYFFFKIISLIFKTKNKGFHIFDEDWDNLIILDACRYDFFKKIIPSINIDGVLKKKISLGSHTAQFLKENFKNRKYENIVYLTANPVVNQLLNDRFYQIISVWDQGWDKKFHTVLPEVMYQYTLNAIKKYPNKKLIIHFMQPHFPYIGYDINKGIINTGIKKSIFSIYHSDHWTKYNLLSLLKGYLKSLQISLFYVKKLVNVLSGTTVITSDHGESFGDYIHPFFPIKFYGHEINVKMPALTEIPWFVIKKQKIELTEKRSMELEKEILRTSIKKLKL
ncbi:MAG: hypothetical protein ACFFA7_00590 [Promethearchaeota archaeon]